MSRSLMIAALAAVMTLTFSAADAEQAPQKKKKADQPPVPAARTVQAPVVQPAPPPVERAFPGPNWAGPNACVQDLGYGRYESCD
jgi:hypothetical protein